jgi:hypothetical protein
MKAALAILKGALIGNAVGAAIFGTGFLLARIPGGQEAVALLGLPSIFVVPFVMGFVAARFWQGISFRIWHSLFNAFVTTCLSVSVAALFFGEGIICLILLSPLFYLAVLAGAETGRIWYRSRGDRLNAVVWPALFIIAAGEPMLRSPHEGVVVDEILITAPPERVWPHVTAFETIPAPPHYWLFRIGLPYPQRTTNDGNFIGADRACEFSGGAVFRERISGFEPARLLTFEIVESPRDPELIGHLDARRGQFELRDNRDGTTMLIGRTWYSLHVRPAWYFDWWTHDIFREVHLRVMRNVKRLAETEP